MVSPLKNKLNLDKSIKKDKSWLDEGSYSEVTILDVDPSFYSLAGRIHFTFEKDKKNHREQIYLLNKQGDGLSWKLANLVAAVFPGPEITDYYQWLTEDDWQDALQSLRGMQLNLTLEYGPGYRIDFDSDKQLYTATNDGEVICETDRLDNLERICKSRNLKKAYRNANNFEPGEDYISKRNLLALRTAIESRERVQAGEEDLPSAKSPRFIRATTRK